jgi:hypothetical protein
MSKALIIGGIVLVLGVVVVAAGAGYWWWTTQRAQPIGPLAAEAAKQPAEATVIGGVAVKLALAGQNYKAVLASDPQNEKELQKEYDTFKAESGIDVRTDIDQIYFAGSKSGEEFPAVALILGRFDADRIGTAVQSQKDKKTTTRTVAGVTMYVTEGGKEPVAVAVPSPQLVVIGTPSLAETVLQNWSTKTRPIAANPELALRLKTLQPAKPALWLFAGPSLLKEIPQPGPGGPNIPTPTHVVLTAELDPDVAFQLIGEMADEKSAQKLAEALIGFKAMAGMFMSQEPKAQEIADALTVGAQGKTVTIALRLTPPMLLAMQESMKKARLSANESAAIGDARTVVSGEIAYQMTAGGGGFGELKCLAQPQSCNPGYEGTFFLDEALVSATEKGGYTRAFHAGPPASTGRGLASFAYTAVPITVGVTGARSFCVDETGVICVNADGAPFPIVGGHCPSGCTVLQ